MSLNEEDTLESSSQDDGSFTGLVQNEGFPSLFPAYNLNQPKKKENTNSTTPLDWLSNSSYSTSAANSLSVAFQTDSSTQPKTSDIKHHEETNDLPKGVKKPKKKHKHKRKHESDSEDGKLNKKEDDSIYDQLSKMVFIEETGLASERAFRIDPKPDRENFVYDTFYKVHIAKYYSNIPVPLGVAKGFEDQLLQLERGSKMRKKIMKREKDARYFSTKSVSRNISKVPVTVCGTPKLRLNEDVTYIPLKISFSETEESLSNNRQDNVNPLGIYDAGTTSYLAGVGKLDEKEAEKVHEQKWETSLHLRTQKYNEALRENPGDENLWVEFVSFQDELSASNPYESEQISNSVNINKALLEKKLAILDRAVNTNPRLLRLAILRLDICSQIMERSKVLSEWKKLTFVHAGNPEIWHSYIEFLKSSLTSFTVSSIIKAYVKAISTLNSILQGTFHTVTVDPLLEEKLIDLFSCFCWFLRESGFTERAIASYQSVTEFNLFEPKLPTQTTFNERVTFFEPFWDSGMARVGEEGAKGWSDVLSQKSFSECPTIGFAVLNSQEDKIMEGDTSLNEYWLDFENLREKFHWLPWRPEEGKNEDCEDPERMVVLDDVSSVLFQLKSEKGKLSLVLHFLRFFGVSRNVEEEEFDRFSCSKSLDEKTFRQIVSFPNETKLDSLSDFVSRLIGQVKPKFPTNVGRELDKILLSFHVKNSISNCRNKKELISELKNLKKIARSILKDENNRNDLYLWSEYAHLEFLSGKSKDALNVLNTIFTSHCGVTEPSRDLFWFAVKAVEMACGLDDLSQNSTLEYASKLKWYLTVLGAGDKFKLQDNDDIPHTLVLKSKHGYKNIIAERDAKNNSVSEKSKVENSFGKKVSEYCLCLNCFVYFQYFTYGLQSAMDFLTPFLSSGLTESGSELSAVDIDYLNKCEVKLLTLHSGSLTLLRPALERTLQYNPTDISYLLLFMKMEGASYLSRKLRKFFYGLLNSKSKNEPIIWYYAIISEWRRISRVGDILKENANVEIPQVGVSWKIRNLFERALTISSVVNTPLIWRMYIKFEMEQGCRDKAKAVFYRSLQKCPGHKVIYLDSAKYFPDSLEEISDLLTEKEIRVRTPLEEIQLLIEHKKSTQSSSNQPQDENKGAVINE